MCIVFPLDSEEKGYVWSDKATALSVKGKKMSIPCAENLVMTVSVENTITQSHTRIDGTLSLSSTILLPAP